MSKFYKLTEVSERLMDRHCRAAEIGVEQLVVVVAGELCAAINAATLALVDAGIAMQDLVVACDAGYLDETALLGSWGFVAGV